MSNIKQTPKQIIYTGHIPQCPYCEKPTIRQGGMTTVTCAYYPPIYDENGNNTNPDRNTRTSDWYCNDCKQNYSISGNDVDGYFYILKQDEINS